MKKLLHIIATPRGEESRTLKISKTFIKAFKEKNPDAVIDELDLSAGDLPSLNLKRVDGKYVLLGGGELTPELKVAWRDIISHIDRFLSADAYLISTPMWNFSIPYQLKHYIDIIVQPKYLFRYTPSGPEGLVKNKKMAIIISRGGDYTSAGMSAFNYEDVYLKTIFGFVGITDIKFIVAEPMDMGVEMQNKKIEAAKALAGKIGENF